MKRFSDWPVLKWDGERWDMMVEVWYQGSWDRFLIRKRKSDLATVPFFMWFLIQKTTGAIAAIFHDQLLEEEVPKGEQWIEGQEAPRVITTRDADGLFHQALIDLDVKPVMAALMWVGVRWGSLFRRDGHNKGWWLDAGKVIPISIVAAPFVLVALVVNSALYCIYLIVEKMCGIFSVTRRKGKGDDEGK